MNRAAWHDMMAEQLELARDQVAATLAAALMGQFAGETSVFHAADAIAMMQAVRDALYGDEAEAGASDQP